MATITTIQETDFASDSRETINDNFDSLNTNKQEIESGKGLSTNDFTDIYKDKLVDLVPNYSLTPDLVDDIQTTINEIYTNGGGTLYLLPGTYTLTSNILIPGGVTLSGTSRDNCIIDCGTFGIKISGSDEYTTGTVTINNGATEVVGVGTTWVDTMVGQSIWLDGYWYEITGFTDTTHIDITTYNGVNLAGANYVIATVNSNAKMSELTLIDSTGTGLEIKYTLEPFIKNVGIFGCVTGCDIQYSQFPQFNVSFTKNGVNLNMNFVEGFYIDYSEFSYSTTGEGIIMTNVNNSTFLNSSIVANTTDGLKMTDCSKLIFISADISSNGGDGIEMVSGCNENNIICITFNSNGGQGIKLTATDDRNSFSQVVVKDNGAYGIHISANTCNDNILVGVIASGNVSGSLSDTGTGTLKSTAVNILP